MHVRPPFIAKPSSATTTSGGGEGPATSAQTVINEYEAAETFGGHRIVRSNDDATVSLADKDDADDADKVLGISTNAVNVGDTVTIISYGPLEEPSWAWDMAKLLFLGDTGIIVQDPPATGFSIQVGFPLSPTSIFVDIQRPIQLA